MSEAVRIGTRGSALALWQAEHVAARLRSLPGSPPVELVTIQTEGDKIQDVPLSKLPGKAFFTKELEQAILDGRTDLAVHSLKDVATSMPEGLTLGAILEREDPRDALVARPGLALETLPEGARVGTSSLRRAAFLRRWRPDLEVLDLRGNVPTRLRRLDEGGYDAIVLAAAGLKRLGLEARIIDYLPFHVLLPAVSQGAIAVQIRAADERIGPWVGRLNHEPTRLATAGERSLLREVEGGCQVPLGAYGVVSDGRLEISAAMAALDGSISVSGSIEGSAADAVMLGRGLASDLMARGGAAVMAGIRGVLDGGDRRA